MDGFQWLTNLPEAGIAALQLTGSGTLRISGSAGERTELPLSAWPELRTLPCCWVVFDWKSFLHGVDDLACDSSRFFDVKLAAMLMDPAKDTSSVAGCYQATFPDRELSADSDELGLLLELYEALRMPMKDNRLFDKVEMPLAAVLAAMEKRGILLDAESLREFGNGLKTQIDALEKEIYEAAGTSFNVNSPKQLSTLLFETLKLTPSGKKTKSGYSTDADALNALRTQHPVIAPILAYRTLSKLYSTYVEGLLKARQSDGRVHTTFQMSATATGRLSSTEPNLQNLPVRTELGGELRRMLVADPGEIFLDADYSQIELRILAHIADDPAMCEAFQKNMDIHAVTASKIFHVAEDAVTPELRRRAKAVNFGIVYGISAFALAQDLGVSRAEAQSFIDSYFQEYAKVHEYLRQVVKRARETGYVETLFGRRRYLPELHSKVFAVRSFGERVALNMPIQGTAADLIKMAMVKVDTEWKRAGLHAQLVLQIHDELLATVPQEEADEAEKILRKSMEEVLALKVPLSVSMSCGKNFLDLADC